MTSDDAIQPRAPMPHPVSRRTAALSAGNFQPLIPGTAKPPLPAPAAAKAFLIDRERFHTEHSPETPAPARGRALTAGSAPPPARPGPGGAGHELAGGVPRGGGSAMQPRGRGVRRSWQWRPAGRTGAGGTAGRHWYRDTAVKLYIYNK